MMPVRKSQNWLPGIFNDFFGNEWLEKANSTSPAINIIESEKDYKVEIAAPGLTKDVFCILIFDYNKMSFYLFKNEDHNVEIKHGRDLRREFSYTQFRQNMILPDNIDKDKIEAKVENGILTIDIPKKEIIPEKPAVRNIEVK